MEFASQLKHSGIPLLLINQEIFGKRSYKKQSTPLLSDIRNYTKTFEYTKRLYIAQYGEIYGEAGGADNWDDWWSNDVYGWANQHQAIMNGYTERMYNIWEKFTPLWCDRMKPPQYHFNELPTRRRPLYHYQIECFLTSYLDKKSSFRQIRSFWGALTPLQRDAFIQNRLENFPIGNSFVQQNN